MDQGGVFVILFKMVRYHQKKYPSYIPLHLEEVAGHFDVRRVFPTLPYSLHTEYSYGKRTFQSELIQKYPEIVRANQDGIPQLWKNEVWAESFAAFLVELTKNMPAPSVIEIHPPFHDYVGSMREFIEIYHLDLSMDGNFNPRDAFGSHDDSDHVYNTPRAWFMERYLNPHTKKWDGPDADYTPVFDDIPWMMVPEKKITVEDVKYVLSSHYQGTPYDPYAAYGDKSWKGAYRSIGVNRTDFLSVIQMRPDHKGDNGILQWIAFASNAFNVLVPFYTDVTTTPEYLSNTTGEVSTDNFYWASRMVAAMADASYKSSIFHIERYQEKVMAKGHALIHQYDALLAGETDETKQTQLREEANNKIAEMLKKETGATLHKVLFELSNQMKNAYSRSDA